jgi:DNA-binding response OmpR family regulator
LDPVTRKVTREGRAIHLTATEFRLLESLMRAAGRVLTRATLIEAVWGIDRDVETNTLDAFIRLLRKKVDEPFQARLVHTVHGIGYRMSPEGE